MKVLTTYPVEIQTKDFSTHSQQGNLDTSYGSKDYAAPNGLGYSSLDGSSGSEAIRTFQVWANINHQARLSADGKYGPLTSAAYAKWGAEWEKIQQPAKVDKPKSASPVPTETLTGSGIPAASAPTKTSLADKFKALSTPAKVGIVLGSVVLFTGIIWVIIPKKGKK